MATDATACAQRFDWMQPERRKLLRAAKNAVTTPPLSSTLAELAIRAISGRRMRQMRESEGHV
jgi:hypothetical protein